MVTRASRLRESQSDERQGETFFRRSPRDRTALPRGRNSATAEPVTGKANARMRILFYVPRAFSPARVAKRRAAGRDIFPRIAVRSNGSAAREKFCHGEACYRQSPHFIAFYFIVNPFSLFPVFPSFYFKETFLCNTSRKSTV